MKSGAYLPVIHPIIILAAAGLALLLTGDPCVASPAFRRQGFREDARAGCAALFDQALCRTCDERASHTLG